jgi:putative flippase GtrA
MGSGLFNTLVGFSVMFTLMWFGVSPFTSNIAGYAVGFVCGFILSKKIVFRSNGSFVAESIRYLIAFLIAFALNFMALHILLGPLQFPPVLYILTRFFVFSSGLGSVKPD